MALILGSFNDDGNDIGNDDDDYEDDEDVAREQNLTEINMSTLNLIGFSGSVCVCVCVCWLPFCFLYFSDDFLLSFSRAPGYCLYSPAWLDVNI